jgi:hypothetical protein
MSAETLTYQRRQVRHSLAREIETARMRGQLAAWLGSDADMSAVEKELEFMFPWEREAYLGRLLALAADFDHLVSRARALLETFPAGEQAATRARFNAQLDQIEADNPVWLPATVEAWQDLVDELEGGPQDPPMPDFTDCARGRAHDVPTWAAPFVHYGLFQLPDGATIAAADLPDSVTEYLVICAKRAAYRRLKASAGAAFAQIWAAHEEAAAGRDALAYWRGVNNSKTPVATQATYTYRKPPAPFTRA